MDLPFNIVKLLEYKNFLNPGHEGKTSSCRILRPYIIFKQVALLGYSVLTLKGFFWAGGEGSAALFTL